MPYVIDKPSTELAGKRPKHTNLTGDRKAYVGGELWFFDSTTLLISGGSGRYPPLDEQQLASAVEVFRSFGYKVTSLGWDPEEGPKRHWEGT